MSATRTVLTVAAAAVIVPLAMRARESAAVRAGIVPAIPASTERRERADPATVRAFLDAVRGSNPVQCEVILTTFNVWSSVRAPDRDSLAWNTAMVVHRDLDRELVRDLAAALRSGDSCLPRVAARMLGRSDLPEARAELLSALGADDASLRRLGAIGIGFTGDSLTSALLVRALGDRDAGVRAAAAWALGAVH